MSKTDRTKPSSGLPTKLETSFSNSAYAPSGDFVDYSLIYVLHFSDCDRGIDAIGEGVSIKRLKSRNVNGILGGVD